MGRWRPLTLGSEGSPGPRKKVIQCADTRTALAEVSPVVHRTLTITLERGPAPVVPPRDAVGPALGSVVSQWCGPGPPL